MNTVILSTQVPSLRSKKPSFCACKLSLNTLNHQDCELLNLGSNKNARGPYLLRQLRVASIKLERLCDRRLCTHFAALDEYMSAAETALRQFERTTRDGRRLR